jgi:APA family basic amino acid/polyamine antiporter
LGAFAAALLFAGIIGKLSTWAGGSARLPFVIGIDGAFPPMFGRLHPRWGTPYVSLIVQGAICSAFLILTQAGETLRAGWQVLVDMSVLCGFLPFIYIFLSAWKFGHRWSAGCGLLVTATSILLSIVPPHGVSSIWWFEAKVLGGCELLAGLGRVAFKTSLGHSETRYRTAPDRTGRGDQP